IGYVTALKVVGDEVWASTPQSGNAIGRYSFTGDFLGTVPQGTAGYAIEIVGSTVWAAINGFTVDRFTLTGTRIDSLPIGYVTALKVVGDEVWASTPESGNAIWNYAIGRYSFTGDFLGAVGTAGYAIEVVGNTVWAGNNGSTVDRFTLTGTYIDSLPIGYVTALKVVGDEVWASTPQSGNAIGRYSFTGDFLGTVPQGTAGYGIEIVPRAPMSIQWNHDGGGRWADAAKWTGTIPNDRYAVANFRGKLATPGNAPATITLDEDRTVGTLNLDNTTTNGTDPVSFIIASGKGGKLILDNEGGAAINVKSGRHIISAPVSIIDGTTVDVAASAKLSITGGISVDDEKTLAKTNSGPLDISGGVKLGDGASLIVEGGTVHADAIRGGLLAIRKGAQVTIKSDAPSSIVSRIAGLSFGGAADVWEGTLDLTNSDLIIEATPQTRDQVLSDVANQIKTARAGGKWTGDGITSSTARDNPYTGLAVLLNYRYGSIKPLLEMFDGESVDNSCILVKYTWDGDANLDGRINADDYFRIDGGFISQEGGYRNGDFNYDGIVNADDYFLIDSAFIGQSGPLRAGAVQPSAVPEPTGLIVLVAGMFCLAARRRLV
ncbi:MAG: hypothetical protein NTU53_16520, partial [Planctomycetota bacterium]|nr:hypothetical protein [Planctomycetota bacterium]